MRRRFTILFQSPRSEEEIYSIVSNYLRQEGFIYTKYREEMVWKKGNGLLLGPKFIKVEVRGHEVYLEAWLKFIFLFFIPYGEIGIDGGFTRQRLLRSKVDTLLSILHQPPQYNNPSNKNMKRVEVAAAIILKEGSVFTARRRFGTYAGFWEFPGGKIKSGETWEDALHREIGEELGIKIRIDSFFTTVEYDYPDFHLTMHCYFCTLRGKMPTLKEHSEAKWLLPKELSTVKWLPADVQLIETLKAYLS